MIGIEGKEGEVLFLPIERTNKYESYDGRFSGSSVAYSSIEVLILWKEVLCSYSLSFLSKKDRDYVLYDCRGVTTLVENEFIPHRKK